MSSVLVLLGKILGAALGFLVTVLIARTLSVENTGKYFLFITAITVFTTLSRCGSDSVIVRFISRERLNSVNSAGSYVLYFIFSVTAITFIFGFALFIFLLLLPETLFTFEDFYMSPMLFIACSVAFNLITVQSQALLGLSRLKSSIITSSILIQLSMVLFLLFFDVENDGDAIFFYFLSLCITVVISSIVIFNIYGKFNSGVNFNYIDGNEIFNSVKPLFFCALAAQIAQWAPQLLLGAIDSSSEVAVLAIAQRVSMVLSFILIAINYSVANKIVRAYSNNNITELKAIVRTSGRIMILFSSPLFIICLFFPNLVISVFGDNYLDAIPILQVLVLGQFLNVITGPTGYLLLMTGNEKLHRNSQFFAALVCLVACASLFFGNGAKGAAIAISLGVISQNVYAVYIISKKLKINTILTIFKII